MGGNRLPVFARRPAPIQVTAWGEPTGTGLETMDYLFADPVLVPKDWRSELTEQVIDLPCFVCHWTPEPLPPVGPPPAIANGYVTFGSFNRPQKISSPVLSLWSAILRAVPSSKLVIKHGALKGTAQESRIRRVLAQESVASDRVAIIGQTDHAAHLAGYHAVDVALDPFPHGGGMTTMEALAMGVPVITCPGETISSRLAAACLSATGLHDFIAGDRDRYVELAVRTAVDLPMLTALRATLQDRLSRTPMGNGNAYREAVEAAYRDIWRRWCAVR
jgi:predicted O-linked N-acetylglucosamine transferase (SPINDLY family)